MEALDHLTLPCHLIQIDTRQARWDSISRQKRRADRVDESRNETRAGPPAPTALADAHEGTTTAKPAADGSNSSWDAGKGVAWDIPQDSATDMRFLAVPDGRRRQTLSSPPKNKRPQGARGEPGVADVAGERHGIVGDDSASQPVVKVDKTLEGPEPQGGEFGEGVSGTRLPEEAQKEAANSETQRGCLTQEEREKLRKERKVGGVMYDEDDGDNGDDGHDRNEEGVC